MVQCNKRIVREEQQQCFTNALWLFLTWGTTTMRSLQWMCDSCMTYMVLSPNKTLPFSCFEQLIDIHQKVYFISNLLFYDVLISSRNTIDRLYLIDPPPLPLPRKETNKPPNHNSILIKVWYNASDVLAGRFTFSFPKIPPWLGIQQITIYPALNIRTCKVLPDISYV